MHALRKFDTIQDTLCSPSPSTRDSIYFSGFRAFNYFDTIDGSTSSDIDKVIVL